MHHEKTIDEVLKQAEIVYQNAFIGHGDKLVPRKDETQSIGNKVREFFRNIVKGPRIICNLEEKDPVLLAYGISEATYILLEKYASLDEQDQEILNLIKGSYLDLKDIKKDTKEELPDLIGCNYDLSEFIFDKNIGNEDDWRYITAKSISEKNNFKNFSEKVYYWAGAVYLNLVSLYLDTEPVKKERFFNMPIINNEDGICKQDYEKLYLGLIKANYRLARELLINYRSYSQVPDS
ncbi:hypothetical protein GF327_01020 [Candidatus Woesearchaeota archaeon]|nr:hypothetical protein [Candidatus Woesearchaeota archaeon]